MDTRVEYLIELNAAPKRMRHSKVVEELESLARKLDGLSPEAQFHLYDNLRKRYPLGTASELVRVMSACCRDLEPVKGDGTRELLKQYVRAMVRDGMVLSTYEDSELVLATDQLIQEAKLSYDAVTIVREVAQK